MSHPAPRVKKAVIPAAGLGTRFLPATKAQPKEMLPIVDKPAIQYIVEEAVASGIEDILIITGRGKRAIEDHFDRSLELEEALAQKGESDLLHLVREIASVEIHYLRQKEPLGLGHAVYCARKFVGDEPFAVLLGDDIMVGDPPCLKEMLDLYAELGGSIVAVKEVPPSEVSRYGIVHPEPVRPGLFRALDLIEKPRPEEAPSRLAIIGRYVLSPSIFPLLETAAPGAGGEIQLTDALRRLAAREPIYAYAFPGRRYDVGDKLGYLKATVEFALARPDLGPPFHAYLKELLSAQSS